MSSRERDREAFEILVEQWKEKNGSVPVQPKSPKEITSDKVKEITQFYFGFKEMFKDNKNIKVTTDLTKPRLTDCVLINIEGETVLFKERDLFLKAIKACTNIVVTIPGSNLINIMFEFDY